MSPKPTGPRPVAQNRKARHDYEILERFEAGVALAGGEVKSIRAGKVQLRDSYARVEEGEVWLHGVHVSPYQLATGFGVVDPDRPRKLLLHRHQIEELGRRTTQDSLTLVPLAIYFKEGRAKVDLALARGRRRYDKRQAIASRDAEGRGLELIGVFHSHTHTDAYPSRTDVAEAPDPAWHYVILSLRDDAPVIRSYRIVDGNIAEEQVVLDTR